jgi:hypothetical protein
VLTADLRFRRTERIVVELSTSLKPDSVSAEVLDRSGKPLALPAAASLVDKDGATWVRGELALASLAVGDYVLRLSATRGSDTRQVLAPFKVVP